MKIPTLTTKRLLLREISEADLEDLYTFSFFDGQPLTTAAGIRDKLARIAHEVSSGNSLHWGLALQENNKIIGAAGFYRGFPNKTGEIGYAINPAYTNQGLMQEAIASIIAYGFEKLKLDKVIAFTKETNLPSRKVLLKTGFYAVNSELPEYLKYEFRKNVNHKPNASN